MIESTWVLLGMALPAAIGAATMLIVGGWRGPSAPGRAATAWAAAAALGWIVGHWATHGLPALPWGQVQNWMPLMALAAAAVALAQGGHRAVRWLQVALRFVLLAGIAALMFKPAIQYAWSLPRSIGNVALAAALSMLAAEAPERLARRGVGWPIAVALAVTALVGGMVTLMSGSQTLGQFFLSLAATVAGAGLIALRWPGAVASLAAAGVVMPILLGLLLFGSYVVDLHLRYVVLIGAAPSLLWVMQLPPLRRLRAWQRAAVGLVAVALPLAIALALTVPPFLEAMRGPGGVGNGAGEAPYLPY